MFALLPLLFAPAVQAQVTATQANGVTNPAQPSFLPVGSQVNQTSMSRLLTLNGVDDFCLFGPPEDGPDSLIGNVEPIVVAYCTKPRNDARLIPDGMITAAHVCFDFLCSFYAPPLTLSSSRPHCMSKSTVSGTVPRSTS